MAFFSEGSGKRVLKGVPPDQSVGAWPSVQKKQTGTVNVGTTLRDGKNDDHQSLKGQENLREYSVANQEAIPSGKRPGICPLPKPRALAPALGESDSTTRKSVHEPSRPTAAERLANVFSALDIHSALSQARISAQEKFDESSPAAEDFTVLKEAYVISFENEVMAALKYASSVTFF